MQFHRETIDFHYINILNGFTPFVFNSEVFLGKHLSPIDIFEVNILLSINKKEYEKNGLLSEYDFLKDLESKRIWIHKDDEEIKAFTREIQQKAKLLPNLFLGSQKKKVEFEIQQLQRKIDAKEARKSTLLANSIESKLQADKAEFLLFRGLYKRDFSRYWTNVNDFNEEDGAFTEEIIGHYFKALREINNSIVRSIARVTDARFRFQHSQELASREVSSYLLELKQWCGFYDKVYELSDRPEDEVIEDDGRLDAWLEGRRSKAKAQNSVSTKDGAYTSFPGGTKEDVGELGGVGRADVMSASAKDWK